MRWHVVFSRNGFPGNLILFPVFLALWSWEKVFRTGQWRYFLFAACGTAWGLYGYQAFRAFPLLLLALLVFEWRAGFLEAKGKKTVVSLFLALILSIPVWVPLIERGGLDPRGSEVSLWPRIEREESLVPFLKNGLSVILMFNYKGDEVSRHNLPGHRMLDDFTCILFALGFFGGLMRMGRRENFYPILGVIVMNLPGLLYDSPNDRDYPLYRVYCGGSFARCLGPGPDLLG